ncbi:MAG: hypothetical protein K2H38_10860 [Muribaculaceae bacterium]|nr:hypothetical protein [Muribaculaceae bacterium]MDE6552684.1 hypothetical protein [Muribaculaceae bacterium]
MKSKIKTLLATVSLASISLTVHADVNTPYSMYGYGIIGERATSMQRQMGGVGYAMQSGRQINAMNPASYASIDSLTFLWDMGANMNMQWQKDNSGKTHGYGGGLDYVTMEFPLSKYMGMSIGMIPVTQVGYSFGNDIQFGARQNQGSGGITEAYAGLSGKIKGFSVGVNVSYDFGTIQNDLYATPKVGTQAVFEHIMQIRDWNIVAGLQYRLPINKYNSLTLGATYSPKKSFHGSTWFTKQDLTADSRADTMAISNMKGKYYSPQTFGAGIAYTHERVHRISVEADLTVQQWSKTPFTSLVDKEGQVVVDEIKFADRIKYAVGGEYTHNVRGTYLERMPWRLGAFYTDDYLRIQGNRMKEYGVSLGTGFAAPGGKTMINFGLEWRHRQTSPVNLLTENYFNIMLGVNFNEVWFFKRKIN